MQFCQVKLYSSFATLRVLAPLLHKKNTLPGVKTLVRAKGLEPSTSTLARLRSSQLSYARLSCAYDYIHFSELQVIFYLKLNPQTNRGIYVYHIFCTEPIAPFFRICTTFAIGQLPFNFTHKHSTQPGI